jgi:hypothetical protein
MAQLDGNLINRLVAKCCCRSGLGANAPVALQPLGLLYYPVPPLFFRRSHCHRQMPPRPTRRDRSKQRKMELLWARIVSYNFCLNADFHVTFRDLLRAANLRHGIDGFTSPPKEIFSPLKILMALAGFEPANLGTKSRHSTSRPPKPIVPKCEVENKPPHLPIFKDK